MLGYHYPIEYLRAALSAAPALRTLTLESARLTFDAFFDGDYWIQIISEALPHLEHFRFHFSFLDVQGTKYVSMDSILAPFRTTYWLEKKKWIAFCSCYLRSGPESPAEINIYTKSMRHTLKEHFHCSALTLANQSLQVSIIIL